jgi:hypothetical protein
MISTQVNGCEREKEDPISFLIVPSDTLLYSFIFLRVEEWRKNPSLAPLLQIRWDCALENEAATEHLMQRKRERTLKSGRSTTRRDAET